MNREILFRGKRMDNREWVEGCYTKDEKDLSVAYIGYLFGVDGETVHDIDVAIVDPETVCQHTGLTDKNGRKIFEGDIVKTKYYGKDTENGCNFNDYDTFAIDYGEAAFRLDNKERRYFLAKLKDIEVIGNIFDNPELL